MNYKTMKLIAVVGLLVSGSSVFAAGFRINVLGESRTLGVRVDYTNGTSDTILATTGATATADGLLGGITGFSWIDCGKLYNVQLAKRIEGIEGWRTLTFEEDGRYGISQFGLLPAIGPATGDLLKAGECPCTVISQ